MRLERIWRLTILLMLGAAISQADTLELKNGSLIRGRFVGGTDPAVVAETLAFLIRGG